jgi:hypothetical protein
MHWDGYEHATGVHRAVASAQNHKEWHVCGRLIGSDP